MRRWDADEWEDGAFKRVSSASRTAGKFLPVFARRLPFCFRGFRFGMGQKTSGVLAISRHAVGVRMGIDGYISGAQTSSRVECRRTNLENWILVYVTAIEFAGVTFPVIRRAV